MRQRYRRGVKDAHVHQVDITNAAAELYDGQLAELGCVLASVPKRLSKALLRRFIAGAKVRACEDERAASLLFDVVDENERLNPRSPL